MKKAILISSHCDNQEKKDLLIKNIKLIKKNNIDVFLYSSVHLENEIIDLSDYYIFTKTNPILTYPLKGMFSWKIFQTKQGLYKISHIYDDWGWAGITQYKNMISLARNLNYDIFYLMIYDVEITENVLKIFKENQHTLFFPSKHKNNKNGEQWKVGSHLICLNKNDCENFLNEITLENYLKNPNNILENFIEEIQVKYNWNVSNILIEDLIQIRTITFNDKELLNKTVKVYFINSIEQNKYGVLLFDVKESFLLKIVVDDVVIKHKIESDNIIFYEKPRQNLTIHIDDNIHDFTHYINVFKQNMISKIET